MAHGQDVQKVTGGGLAHWQLELALRLLLRDLGDDSSVADLASRCGLSRSYFVRAFKLSMGMPPHRWLVRERVHRAAEMLERTNKSISTIAVSCGFSDQSHLTRVFCATIGSSPAAWRRQRKAGVAPPIPPVTAYPARSRTRSGAGPHVRLR
jgi:AraC family transcriptional regulator